MEQLTAIIQAIVSGLLMGGVYGLIAVGLTLIFGVMKIINFAHGSFLMLGMYVSYWVFVLFGIDPFISIFLSAICLFVVGFIVQKILLTPVMDSSEYSPLLVTLGLWLFLDNFALFLWGPDFKVVKVSYSHITFDVNNIMISFSKLIAFVMSIALSFGLYLLLKTTYLGKAIRAIADEKSGAILMGINVTRINCITFGIGAACAGIAGTVIVPFFHIEPMVGDSFVITAFVVVVLGGLGSFVGSLVGGIILGVLEALGAILLSGSLKMLVIYTTFFLVLLFKPTGLFGKQK